MKVFSLKLQNGNMDFSWAPAAFVNQLDSETMFHTITEFDEDTNPVSGWISDKNQTSKTLSSLYVDVRKNLE